MMTERQLQLYDEAITKYPFVYLPSSKERFEDCFLEDRYGRLYFTFNDPDGNTHVIIEKK